MAAKTIFTVFAVLLAQTYACPTPYSFSSGILGSGCLNQVPQISSYGGSFPVISSSSVYPIGLSIVSDLDIGGNLNVCGTVPFVSAVSLNGCLPTSGLASANYNCGSGLGIVESVPSGYGCGCSRYGYY